MLGQGQKGAVLDDVTAGLPTVRRIEQGEIDGISALDEILTEELTLRENRRVKTALLVARLTIVKTLAGFDFAFQPSLDRQRILALAELKFIDWAEVVHLLDDFCSQLVDSFLPTIPALR